MIGYAFLFFILSTYGYFWVRRFKRDGEPVSVIVKRPSLYSAGIFMIFVADKYQIVSGKHKGVLSKTSWRRVPIFETEEVIEGLYLVVQNRVETKWSLELFENLYKTGFIGSVIFLFLEIIG